MLRLRHARVVSIEEAGDRVVRMTVELDGEHRPALAYPGLTGTVASGDEVLVNVEAADLRLGSGGFDIVHAGPLREPEHDRQDAHVMKLNYTSLQHAVSPLEEGLERLERPLALPVGVLALHGQLPCATFAIGATMPYQFSASTWGKPSSAVVGTLGRLGARWRLPTAMALSFPASSNGSRIGRSKNAMCICWPMMSFTAGGAPL